MNKRWIKFHDWKKNLSKNQEPKVVDYRGSRITVPPRTAYLAQCSEGRVVAFEQKPYAYPDGWFSFGMEVFTGAKMAAPLKSWQSSLTKV